MHGRLFCKFTKQRQIWVKQKSPNKERSGGMAQSFDAVMSIFCFSDACIRWAAHLSVYGKHGGKW